ncbi:MULTISPECIES: MFS transporter [unclassified Kitasatospora]|nr:MFS transporter [Kitasatospora sp. GAS204B]
MVNTLRRQARFRNLWIGQSISVMGTAVTEIAMPLTSAVYLKVSTFQMGLLSALGFLPWLVIGLQAGSWVDRSSHRRTLILTDLLRFGLLAIVPICAWCHVLNFMGLAFVVLCVGVCTVFANSASSAVLPELIDEEQLVEGNSLTRLSQSVSYVAGPGLGGWLVGVLTAPVALVVDSLSYLVSALFMFRLPEQEARKQPERRETTLRQDIGEGLRTLFGNRYLRPAVLSTGALALGNGIFGPVYILFLTRTLGLAPSLVAVPFMVFGAGAIAGSLSAASIGRRFGFGPTLIVAGLLNGLASFAFPLLGHRPVSVLVVSAPWLLFGFIAPVYGSLTQTLIQSASPAGMLGRISSASSVLSWGLLAVSAVLGGWLGTAVGLRGSLLICCGAYLASPLFMIFSPARSLRKPQEAKPVDAEAAEATPEPQQVAGG